MHQPVMTNDGYEVREVKNFLYLVSHSMHLKPSYCVIYDEDGDRCRYILEDKKVVFNMLNLPQNLMLSHIEVMFKSKLTDWFPLFL